jgi:hypothetical protein
LRKKQGLRMRRKGKRKMEKMAKLDKTSQDLLMQMRDELYL